MKDIQKKLDKLYEMSGSANITCSQLTTTLKALGFSIRDGSNGGHKIAKHPAVSVLDSPDYNCGHKEGNKIKKPYISKLIKFVKNNEEAIKESLK
jgi:hypothetical protein